MNTSLQGRVAFIAGAAGGLGSVASAAFAQAGANLVLLGHNAEKLEVLAAKLNLPSSRVSIHAGNASSQQETEAAASTAIKKFGRIDVLVNLVGGWIGGKDIFATSREDMAGMIDQHLFASYTLIKTCVPHMLANKWGRVLAVSSPNAGRPPGNNSPYAVGKAAMEALMLSLAQEVRATGVTANLLLVKMIDTAHQRTINPSKENKSWTSPEEISATLLHLCSEEAGMINGARLPLYGEPY
ncbi:MAG: SDR family oxidoreductase [Anaerolineales bacterium]